jgi:hypothetical protein
VSVSNCSYLPFYGEAAVSKFVCKNISNSFSLSDIAFVYQHVVTQIRHHSLVEASTVGRSVSERLGTPSFVLCTVPNSIIISPSNSLFNIV